MIGREVWGWRILALMLVILLVPTIPNLSEIETEWRNSIEGEEASPSTEETEETVEPQADESPEADESQDGATAEASIELSEDEPQQDSRDEDDSNIEPIIENSSQQNWVLPATQIIALTFMMIMAVGLITSTATMLLASEAARMGVLLAVLGPLIGITQRGEGGIFTRGRLLGFIEAHPSIHFSALRDALR